MPEQKNSRRQFWWIVAKDEDSGRDFLIFGSDRSEEDARTKGMEMLGANFDIKRFPTKDISAASAMLRGKKLEQTHSLSKSTERLRHKVKDGDHIGKSSSVSSSFDGGIFS